MEALKAIKLTESVYWVGAIDWQLRDFHGIHTPRGSTYNAYLVMGREPILIDTVQGSFKDELLSRVASVVDPQKIKYLISNHTEPDHSGLVPDMINLIKPEKVFASLKGVEHLSLHYRLKMEITPVKNGESLVVGGRPFTFIETRMLHWPDSMFSYLSDEKVLFSSDAFGMHLAGYERFASEVDPAILEQEGRKYYANIIGPYSPLVLKLLEKVAQLNLGFQYIMPDHGPIWHKDIDKVLGFYRTWAEAKPLKKAVIVFDTMWHSTERMAAAIAEGLSAGGVQVKVMKLRETHLTDIISELQDAKALITGSPTLNNNMLPSMGQFLTYYRGFRPQNKIGAVFGSFGWSGESTRLMKEALEAAKIPVLGELASNFVPDDKMLEQCLDLGKSLAAKILENAG